MAKDSDFASLLHRHGPPPRVVLLTRESTPNSGLRALLLRSLSEAIRHLIAGEPIMEIA